MKNIGNAAVLDELVDRLGHLTPDAAPRWGTLSAPEMLAHLGDAGDSVLGRRTPPGVTPENRLPFPVKWVMLYSRMPFPKGVQTREGVDPKRAGSRPGNFEADRLRVIDGLRALAIAPPDGVAPTHFRFGSMSLRAWHHWAWKHSDHHLRQFGV